ncbi:hypothetical protein SG1531 [Sodalis glossinidius str. 'morsitans']|uniref:EAL domain-containing protein n=1 Tax=Sodalis glossinidius (strain morsitans) TaxID=343509 RepID=Q2NSR9_SODGM|nr:hypothetical protein SG1531 [Sodalis glossinidius str. 'morsitans']
MERVAAILQSQQCDPSRIELGVNESVLFNQDTYSLGILQSLRANGFKITVENFGVRYASIRHLNQFPVDKIKIDPSFIQHMGQDDNAATIVESVIRLGHAMGVSVTARGVDSEEKRAALAQVGCNELRVPYSPKPYRKSVWRRFWPPRPAHRRPTASTVDTERRGCLERCRRVCLPPPRLPYRCHKLTKRRQRQRAGDIKPCAPSNPSAATSSKVA